jgi:hypothetical protein
VLDNFAYYVRRYSQTGNEAEALGAYCRSWVETYDLLVRLPIAEPLAAEGFRSTDQEFQREIDRWCDEMFEVYNERTRPLYVRGPMSATEIARFILESDQPRVQGLTVG